MIDYHIHPYYSLDAKGTIEEYCERATKFGLEEICFTPHFEIDPVRKKLDDKVRIGNQIVSMKSNWIEIYLKDLKNAKNKYPDLKIKAGIEVGYEFEIENELREFLNKYEFDFILGAIHCVDHIAISDHRECYAYFKTIAPGELCKKYFALLEALIKSGLFDCVAHLDVYKKYGFYHYGDKLIKEAEPYIDKIIKLIKSRAMPIEVNTNSGGKKRGFNELYPSPLILKKLHKNNPHPILTIGSDAHKPEHLGLGIKEALDTLNKLELKVFRVEAHQFQPATVQR
ncbi:histidinol-phosphatase [candidate division WOR-3 bacterium]|nr:histidinol-phosphatase [candidate division WOR-3 bacterium]